VLRLVDLDLPAFDDALATPSRLAARLEAREEPGWIGFPEAFELSRAELSRRPEIFGFWTCVFLLEERAERTLIGLGGYKGPPDGSGCVEIGYNVAPAFRGRGIATQAAAELVRRAFADPRVASVCAHTLPEHNASVRVLEKNGFRQVGEAVDDDVGRVWRWQLERTFWGVQGGGDLPPGGGAQGAGS